MVTLKEKIIERLLDIMDKMNEILSVLEAKDSQNRDVRLDIISKPKK